jgi:hypothetical protein
VSALGSASVSARRGGYNPSLALHSLQDLTHAIQDLRRHLAGSLANRSVEHNPRLVERARAPRLHITPPPVWKWHTKLEALVRDEAIGKAKLHIRLVGNPNGLGPRVA